jgi:hypothetical protein
VVDFEIVACKKLLRADTPVPRTLGRMDRSMPETPFGDGWAPCRNVCGLGSKAATVQSVNALHPTIPNPFPASLVTVAHAWKGTEQVRKHAVAEKAEHPHCARILPSCAAIATPDRTERARGIIPVRSRQHGRA